MVPPSRLCPTLAVLILQSSASCHSNPFLTSSCLCLQAHTSPAPFPFPVTTPKLPVLTFFCLLPAAFSAHLHPQLPRVLPMLRGVFPSLPSSLPSSSTPGRCGAIRNVYPFGERSACSRFTFMTAEPDRGKRYSRWLPLFGGRNLGPQGTGFCLLCWKVLWDLLLPLASSPSFQRAQGTLCWRWCSSFSLFLFQSFAIPLFTADLEWLQDV